MRYYGGTVLREKKVETRTVKQVQWWKIALKSCMFPLLVMFWIIQISIHFCLESEEY